MPKVVIFLMPYLGHLTPNLPLLKALSRLGCETVVYCGAAGVDLVRHHQALPRQYPVFTQSWFNTGTGPAVSRRQAAANYHGYFTEKNTREQHQRQHDLMTRQLALVLGQELEDLSPDYIICDAQATFLDELLLRVPYGITRINMSTFPPDFRRSESFRLYYEEILVRESPASMTLDGLVGLLSSGRARNERRGKKEMVEPVFSYISPSLQDETPLLSESMQMLGWSLDPGSLANQREGIYLTRGTIADRYNEWLLRESLEALKDQNQRVIANIGRLCYQEGCLSDLAGDKIFLLPSTDQISALKQAAIYFTHGGITGVREAIFTETPMLLLPANFPDFQIARAVDRAGAGIMLHERPVNNQEVLAALEEIMSHRQEYVFAVRELKQELSRTWQEKGVKYLLENFEVNV